MPGKNAPLEQACLFLRNAAPEQFDRFMEVFTSFTDAVTVAVTDAPPERILVAQGHAQQCRALYRIFYEGSHPKPVP